MTRYSLDTSAIIDGLTRYYPIEVFPSLWDRVDAEIERDRIFWSEEVMAELALGNDFAKLWAEARPRCHFLSGDLWTEAERIQQRFNPDHLPSGINGADSFVIAAAVVGDMHVVTGEKLARGGAPKIPNVCESLDIEYMNFTGFIRAEGWTF